MADLLPRAKRHTPKFIKGGGFASYGEMCEWLLGGGKYVFLRDKPVHPSWMISMSLWTLRSYLRAGCLKKAELNPDWKKQAQQEIERYDK